MQPRLFLSKLLTIASIACFDISIARSADVVDFTRDVRPILETHCFACHGPEKQESGFRLDRKQAALRGGDSYAPAIRPGKSSASPLFQFVSRPDADLKMPPEGPRLSSAQITVLRNWIEQGAAWPEDAVPVADPLQEHWAFQPLRRPPVPVVSESAALVHNPIDRFIFAELEQRALSPSSPAEREVWVRRVYFDLIGLPPTWDEVVDFVRDEHPLAYDKLVDRLLASPHYGERWARHWLDVIRFAESHGFEMNQARPNAWPFRDYVVRAFNEDLPYDQFVRQQLAGDLSGAHEATGFLVAGPWDQVKSPDPVLTAQQRADELHDMISTTGSAFLGLTVGCARCHSHKFDPISQTDYYAVKACFEGVQHGDRELLRRETEDEQQRQIAIELARSELATFESQPGAVSVNARVNVERFPAVSAKKVRMTIKATNQAQPCIDEFEVWSTDPIPRNVALAASGARASASSVYPHSEIHRLEHLHDGRYGNSRSWISNEPGAGWVEIEFRRIEKIDRVMWGRDREEKFTDRLATDYVIEVSDGSAWRVVASAADHVEAPLRIANRKKLEQRLAALQELPKIYAGKFTPPPVTQRFHRGDPLQPREVVPPGSLKSFGFPFELSPTAPEKERRAALADWIVDPRNPLTARVMVNRIWQQHFGDGLVTTPSDFGLNGGRPSHPEMLDWLADELIGHGWSLKHIQRLIVLSATYRQSSSLRPDAVKIDANTRLLWRYPPRRLEAEALRDAILAVCGNLDARIGGPGFDLFEPNDNYVKVYQPRQDFGPAQWRRMVYQSKPRMQLDDTFGAFDCPDAGQIAPRRSRSTTALQALNLLNSPFTVQQSEIFARRLQREAGETAERQAQLAFILAFQRQPDQDEIAAAVRLVQSEGLIVFCRTLLNANEFLYVF